MRLREHLTGGAHANPMVRAALARGIPVVVAWTRRGWGVWAEERVKSSHKQRRFCPRCGGSPSRVRDHRTKPGVEFARRAGKAPNVIRWSMRREARRRSPRRERSA